MGDLGSIPGLGRSPGVGKSYTLQYPGLENSMDCIVHGVAKIQTRLSDFHKSKTKFETVYYSSNRKLKTKQNRHTANSDGLLLLLQYGFFFPHLVAVAKNSKNILNKSGESRHSCLGSDFRGISLTFHH